MRNYLKYLTESIWVRLAGSITLGTALWFVTAAPIFGH